MFACGDKALSCKAVHFSSRLTAIALGLRPNPFDLRQFAQPQQIYVECSVCLDACLCPCKNIE